MKEYITNIQCPYCGNEYGAAVTLVSTLTREIHEDALHYYLKHLRTEHNR